MQIDWKKAKDVADIVGDKLIFLEHALDHAEDNPCFDESNGYAGYELIASLLHGITEEYQNEVLGAISTQAKAEKNNRAARLERFLHNHMSTLSTASEGFTAEQCQVTAANIRHVLNS